MTPPLDLEELKRLVAEADDAGDDVDPAIYTAFRNAIPELIARVERAEALIEAATECAKANIDYWGAKANEADYNTEKRGYCRGRVMTAINISNALPGDTPNV